MARIFCNTKSGTLLFNTILSKSCSTTSQKQLQQDRVIRNDLTYKRLYSNIKNHHHFYCFVNGNVPLKDEIAVHIL